MSNESPPQQLQKMQLAKPIVGRTDASTKVVELLRRGLYSYLVVGLVPLSFLVFSILKPDAFLTVANVQDILTSNAPILIVCLTLAPLMAAGEFDLSFYGMLGCSASLFATAPSHFGVHSQVVMFLIVIVFGLVVGVINAVIVVKLNVSSFIATLGMALLLEGIGLGLTNSATVPYSSSWLTTISNKQVGGIGLPFFYGVIILLLLYYILEHTPIGRYTYFTGEGRTAARLAGVRVERIRAGGFVVASLGAAVAGLFLMGQTGSADATVGEPFILEVFAALYLGFTTIKVGRFNAVGTGIGVAVLGISTVGLDIVTSSAWAPDVFTGCFLIVAICLANVLGKGA